ncbi:MAG: hypothetical protein ACRELY_32320 [Polyangiaceae bacterium]
MRRKALALLVFASSAGVVACSLFVDTSDLESGSGSDASTLDASTSDALAFDARASGDSSVADAGFIFTCDATLCDDFDESTTFNPVWSPQAGTGSALNIVAKGKSLPNAFEPTMVAQPGQSYGDLDAVYSSTPASFRLEFDFFLPVLPVSDETDVVDVEAYGSLPSGPHLYFAMFGSQWVVANYETFPDGGSLDDAKNCVVTPVVGAWNHMLMTSDGSTWSVSVNGVVAATVALDPAAAENGIPRTLHLGWSYVQKNTVALDAYYDDVSMTFLP